MSWKNEWKPLSVIVAGFIIIFFLPVDSVRFDNAVIESLRLVKWYTREHVILCLTPAFFIAGALSVFLSQNSVLQYLGSKANKIIAYGVASVSGSVLAVCSCTILPLFAGIYRMGAGLGPAAAFLYAGPSINVLAIILTARILGFELGVARVVGAVFFSIFIGLVMEIIFSSEEQVRLEARISKDKPKRTLVHNSLFFGLMIAILVFANWGKPQDGAGVWYYIYTVKWYITALVSFVLSILLIQWLGLRWWKVGLVVLATVGTSMLFPGTPLLPFIVAVIGLSILLSATSGEPQDWINSTWDLTKQIIPLLFAGILVSGVLLGRPGEEGLIPSSWVVNTVGGNSFYANLFASIAGAFMYFATLTEVPILQGLIGNGMGKGPALALLLAGPALSLPNMLVIGSVMGTKKTAVYISLVIIMATASGLIFGAM